MENNTGTFSAPSFLDEDLSSVDTSMPVIKGGQILEYEVAGVTEETNKDQTGTNLIIKIKTVNPTVSTKGETINPGFPMRRTVSLVQALGRAGKQDYDADSIKRMLAQFVESVEGRQKGVPSAIKPLERFAGKHGLMKVTVVPANDQFPNESNSITFVPAGTKK